MLDKLKNIALGMGVSSLFVERCGCGYKKYKRAVWVALAVVGLFLILVF